MTRGIELRKHRSYDLVYPVKVDAKLTQAMCAYAHEIVRRQHFHRFALGQSDGVPEVLKIAPDGEEFFAAFFA